MPISVLAAPLILLAFCSTEGRVGHVTCAGQDAVDAAASGAEEGCRAGLTWARERPTETLTYHAVAYGEDVWSRCPAWHQRPMRAPKPGPRTSSSVPTATKQRIGCRGATR